MIYKIYGKPIPLKRPRTSFLKKIVYDPQKDEKEDAITQLRLQHKNLPILDGPLNLNVTFFMPPPPSMSYKKKCFLYDLPHFKKPDLSNLIKYLEDVAQGIIFSDDSRITSISAKKIYAETARTEFQITRTGNEEKEEGNQKA